MLRHKIVSPAEITNEYKIVSTMYKSLLEYLNTLEGPKLTYIEKDAMGINHVLVYTKDTPIGFFTIIDKGNNTSYILNLYVCPEYRPSGILDYILNYCRQECFQTIEVKCRIGNKEALDIYVRKGFKSEFNAVDGLYTMSLSLYNFNNGTSITSQQIQ